jgi:hypothetical protein
MAELDHIVFACKDVDEGTRLIAELTGAEAVVGGPHIGRGTRNTLLTFDDRTYFEIIGIDPDQPEPERARGFGIDNLTAPKLVAFAIHPVGDETLHDLAEIVRSNGFDPGEWMAMSRQKPDGELLEWELTAGGDTGFRLDGAIPFAIDWLGKPSPATTLPSMGDLVELSVHHPDERVGSTLADLGLDKVRYHFGPARLTVTLTTPNGEMTLG